MGSHPNMRSSMFFLLQRVAQPRSEIVRIEQVAHADARPFVLVGIRWAYSFLVVPIKSLPPFMDSIAPSSTEW